jgi:hypothetical protein
MKYWVVTDVLFIIAIYERLNGIYKLSNLHLVFIYFWPFNDTVGNSDYTASNGKIIKDRTDRTLQNVGTKLHGILSQESVIVKWKWFQSKQNMILRTELNHSGSVVLAMDFLQYWWVYK